MGTAYWIYFAVASVVAVVAVTAYNSCWPEHVKRVIKDAPFQAVGFGTMLRRSSSRHPQEHISSQQAEPSLGEGQHGGSVGAQLPAGYDDGGADSPVSLPRPKHNSLADG